MREISVPAPFTVGEHDNVAAMVFEHERDDPDYVIYQRLIDGVWTDVTCAEAANQIRAAALGLISLGVQAGDRVVIFSATRYEWAILDFAILAVGAVTVPIYETSSAEQVRWVLQDSEAVVLFAETDSHATMVAELSGSVPAAGGTADRRFGSQRARSAHGGGRLGRPGRANRPPRRTTVDGPGDAYLHLGHHRTTQGLPVDPIQPGSRD